MRIVCLSKRGLTFAQLTPPQQAAVWQWMWHEGGFETEAQAKQSCLRCRYKVEDIPIQQVMAVWRRVAGTSGLAGFGVEKTDKHWNGTAARVSKIQKTKMDWPYVVGAGATFAEWAKDEMNHGDGFHRTLAAYWSGKPTMQFLYML